MQTRRWTNPTQPQTLQIAVFLLYLRAVFDLLDLVSRADDVYLFLTFRSAVDLVTLLLVVGQVAGGNGIANERKWGYAVAVAAAAVPVTARLYASLRYSIGLLEEPIGLMFAIALVALLLHPQSRDYQRIWFK